MDDKAIFLYLASIIFMGAIPWFSLRESERIMSRTFKAMGGAVICTVFVIFGIFDNGGHPTAMGILVFFVVLPVGGIGCVFVLVSGLVARLISKKITQE